MKCIICDIESQAKSVEHIVSESFGNKDYIIEKGAVCDVCNCRFSKFEAKAMNNTVFIMERARFARATKKGVFAKGQIGKLRIEGNKDFKKDYITLYGLKDEDIDYFDPTTGTFKLKVSSFFKSEVSTSKLLLKTGIESIYQSHRTLFKKYNFSDLKDFLCSEASKDWPFITTDFEIDKFNYVPRFSDKMKLKKIRCDLKFLEYKNHLLFKFKYGSIPMVISLSNRGRDWIKDFVEIDKTSMIYPEHFRKTLKSTITNNI